jgi:hypothetical protein
MGTRPRPRQAAAAAAGWDGAWEARTGLRPTQTCCDTPATARLCRGSQLTTLQSTKRQSATAGAVEWGGRVTTARQTTTRAAPGCSPPSTYARWRCTEAAHNAHMMMPFNCSYRNKNETSAIYQSFGYSPSSASLITCSWLAAISVLRRI